jgi:hypothetical protein
VVRLSNLALYKSALVGLGLYFSAVNILHRRLT